MFLLGILTKGLYDHHHEKQMGRCNKLYGELTEAIPRNGACYLKVGKDKWLHEDWFDFSEDSP